MFAGFEIENVDIRSKTQTTVNAWSWLAGKRNSITYTDVGERSKILLVDNLEDWIEYDVLDSSQRDLLTNWTVADYSDIFAIYLENFLTFLEGGAETEQRFELISALSFLTESSDNQLAALQSGDTFDLFFAASNGYSSYYEDFTLDSADLVDRLENLSDMFLADGLKEAILEGYVETDASNYLQYWMISGASDSSAASIHSFADMNLESGFTHRVEAGTIAGTDYTSRLQAYLRSDDGTALRDTIHSEIYSEDLENFGAITGIDVASVLSQLGLRMIGGDQSAIDSAMRGMIDAYQDGFGTTDAIVAELKARLDGPYNSYLGDPEELDDWQGDGLAAAIAADGTNVSRSRSTSPSAG